MPDNATRTAASPAEPSTLSHASAAAPVSVPTVVGRFAVLEELARGGMGVVYRARDPMFSRDVAVKLIHPTQRLSTSAIRRFTDEATITGQLQHPGIPPVFELGTLPDGSPFLALKLIKGQTLDEQLKDRPDPATERGRFVAIFEKLCEAVGYAHAHGVIHRDLKPANVMVGAHGEVQVMDWGLAKVLTDFPLPSPQPDPEATLGTEIRTTRAGDLETQAGSMLGTPAFMPPEQAIGAIDQVDRQSDVFALGAVLCAILTGNPPYVGPDSESIRQLAARGKLDDAFARLAACGAEADLLALCRRCLSADKADRPGDAGAVASAVAGVRTAAEDRARRADAERATAEVRTAEQHKRQRLLLTLGSAVVVFLIVATALILMQWQRAENALNGVITEQGNTKTALDRVTTEQGRTQAALAKAAAARDRARRALDDMTTEVAGESLTTQKELSREQKAFLGGLVDHYRALAAESGDERDARIAGATAAGRVGVIEARLGNAAASEAPYRRAREGFAALVAENPADLDARRSLAMVHNDLGSQMMLLGRPAEAEFKAALEIFAALAAGPTGTPTDHMNAGIAGLNLGIARASAGQVEDAEAEYRRTAAYLGELIARYPDRPEFRRHLASIHNQLGNLYKDTRLKDIAKAEAETRAALALRMGLVWRAPNRREFISELSGSHNNLGLILDDTNRSEAAEQHYREAIRLRERLSADYPGVFEYRLNLGGTYGNLGRLYRRTNRTAASLPWFGKAIDILTLELEQQPQHAILRFYLRNVHASRATAFIQLERHAEACSDWDRAVQLSPPPEVARLRALRATSLAKAGRTGEAVSEAAAMTKLTGWSAQQWYDFARVYSLAAAADAGNRDVYARRSIELLRSAVAAGWNNALGLVLNADLAAARERSEFQTLIAEIKDRKSP